MGGWTLEYVRALPLGEFNRIVRWINTVQGGDSGTSLGATLGDDPGA